MVIKPLNEYAKNYSKKLTGKWKKANKEKQKFWGTHIQKCKFLVSEKPNDIMISIKWSILINITPLTELFCNLSDF